MSDLHADFAVGNTLAQARDAALAVIGYASRNALPRTETRDLLDALGLTRAQVTPGRRTRVAVREALPGLHGRRR